MKRYFSLDLEACKNANLDTTEWLFLENIKFVQHYEGNAVSGWCSKSKKALAEHLGISERKVFLMIDELYEKGFLIKHDETGFLKTTRKWDDICSMPAKTAMAMQQIARNIKKVLCVEDWNKTTPEKLKQRDEIHKNLGMLLKANVEINEAFKIAVNEVLNG